MKKMEVYLQKEHQFEKGDNLRDKQITNKNVIPNVRIFKQLRVLYRKKG